MTGSGRISLGVNSCFQAAVQQNTSILSKRKQHREGEWLSAVSVSLALLKAMSLPSRLFSQFHYSATTQKNPCEWVFIKPKHSSPNRTAAVQAWTCTETHTQFMQKNSQQSHKETTVKYGLVCITVKQKTLQRSLNSVLQWLHSTSCCWNLLSKTPTKSYLTLYGIITGAHSSEIKFIRRFPLRSDDRMFCFQFAVCTFA